MFFLCHFQHLRSCLDAIEAWNCEEIPFSPQIVPRGLSVAEDHRQHSASSHSYIATRPTCFIIWGSSEPANSRLGARHLNHLAMADPPRASCYHRVSEFNNIEPYYICNDILLWMFCVAHASPAIQHQKSVKRVIGVRY